MRWSWRHAFQASSIQPASFMQFKGKKMELVWLAVSLLAILVAIAGILMM